MMRLVKSIEDDEKAHQAILNEVKNEEEHLKMRKNFISVKEQNQKAIKKMMAKHKKEAENLDKQELNAKLKESKAKQQKEEEGAEEGHGEEEQENNEGEEEMAMA